MKKWFATILLIISVACSVIPCCQFDDCAAEQISKEAPTHENENEGACSPFFSCTTCSGFTQITKPIQLPQLTIQKQIHHSAGFAFNLPDYNSSFWQPPRFC